MRSMGTSLPRRPVNREGAANVSATTDGVECRRLQSLDVGGLKVAGGPAEVERARSRPRELTQGGSSGNGPASRGLLTHLPRGAGLKHPKSKHDQGESRWIARVS